MIRYISPKIFWLMWSSGKLRPILQQSVYFQVSEAVI